MAGRSLGSLTLDLILKMGGFEQGMDKAARLTDKRMREMEARAKKFGVVIGAAVAGAAVAAAAGVKSAIDYADQLNDMNQRLGVSAEALSGWAYAAKQSGTDIDALGIGLKKLAKNMAEALDPKSTQGRLFEQLGVSITDAAGRLRSVEDVLPEVASKFKELDNATLESALAMDLFGKSGTDLIEFLNQGEDGLAQFRDRARELGIELDGSTLQAADAFNDSLTDLKTAVDGLWTRVAADLLPDLIRLVQVFIDLTKEGDGTASTAHKIADGFRVIGVVAESSASLISSITQILGGFVQQAWGYYKVLAGILSLDMSTLKSGWGTIKDSGKNISAGFGRLVDPHGSNALFKPGKGFAQYDGPLLAPSKALAEAQSAQEARLARSYMAAPKAGGGGRSRSGGGGKSDAQREAEQLQAAYDRMNASLAEQVALFGATGQAGKLRYELENGELAKLTQAQKDSLIVHAEKLDQMERMKDAQDAQIRALADEKAAVESVLARLDDEYASLTLSNVELAKRNALLGLSAEAQAEWGDAIGNSIEELNAMREQVSFMDDVRGTFNDFFMDVFTGTKSIKDAFKDLFDNIAQMITQRIVDGWLDKLFGGRGTTGGGTSGGDFFSSLLGMFGFGGANANGNAFSGGNVVPFANGGVVSAPQFFPMAGSRMGLMGEAGPEAIMPLARVNGKLGVRMSGSGGGIVQNVYVQGRPDKSTLKQMERASGRGAAREMSRTGR